MSDFFNDRLKNPLIFFGISLLLIIIAITVILLTNSAELKSLEVAINKFTETNFDGKYTLQTRDTFANLSNNTKVRSWSVSTTEHIVLLRLTTICGPVPAVFIYDDASSKTDFLGILGVAQNSPERYGVTSITLQHAIATINEFFAQSKTSEGGIK